MPYNDKLRRKKDILTEEQLYKKVVELIHIWLKKVVRTSSSYDMGELAGDIIKLLRKYEIG